MSGRGIEIRCAEHCALDMPVECGAVRRILVVVTGEPLPITRHGIPATGDLHRTHARVPAPGTLQFTCSNFQGIVRSPAEKARQWIDDGIELVAGHAFCRKPAWTILSEIIGLA